MTAVGSLVGSLVGEPGWVSVGPRLGLGRVSVGSRSGLGRGSVGSRSGLGWQPGRGPVGDLIDAWPGAR
ncbi:putative serine-threonine protein kinase [Burkholderia pseudomallei]|nr:putative serine-threonine protein kinase [Burkholderia pseudomallei]